MAESPDFRKAVENASECFSAEARAALAAAAPDAVAVLSSIISDSDQSAGDRIKASNTLLRYAFPAAPANQVAVVNQNGATQEQLEEAKDNLMRKLMQAVEKESA